MFRGSKSAIFKENGTSVRVLSNLEVNFYAHPCLGVKF